MFSHLTKRRNTYFARLNIPADVQPAFDGRKIFITSTRESDPKRANAIAGPLIAAWQRRIDDARLTRPDPGRPEIERLAAEYRRLKGDGGLDEAASLLVFDVTQFVFERLGGLTADQRRQALIASRGKVADALKNLAAPDDAIFAFDRIIGRSTPFLAHFEAWKGATHLKGKTLDQACSQINKFALAVPNATLEGLTGGMVQKWIEGLLHPAVGDGINPKTVNSYLASIRNYWEWLQSHDHVTEGSRPFWNRKVNGNKIDSEQAGDDRERFEPVDDVRLWQAAEGKHDLSLANAIKLAAFTGARREGICSLKTTSIRTDPATKIRFLHLAEKTRAGRRDVPIHSAIGRLVDDLINGADKDGYLIPSDENKYGNRGDAIGKRFTRLKTDLGFDDKHVFHSIRHTVAHLLESAECPENVAKDVVGHVKQSMTYGLYSGVTKLDLRAKWMEKAIRYPGDCRRTTNGETRG